MHRLRRLAGIAHDLIDDGISPDHVMQAFGGIELPSAAFAEALREEARKRHEARRAAR